MSVKKILDTHASPVVQDYVFALLPEKAKDAYEGFVKKAAESLGFKCESFIDYNAPGDALNEVLEGIKKAEILIYDITDFTPNVMWELGVGLTIKDEKNVIVIRQKCDKPLPFSIHNHRVSYEYDMNGQDSLNDLHNTLVKVLGNIQRNSKGDNPIKSPEVRKLVEDSIRAIKERNWMVAEILFKEMDAKEPNNWYVYNQWGIMLRSKNEFENAVSKFNQAIQFTNYEDQKVYVYIELAILNKITGKHAEAEAWFKKAEKVDNKNKKLYVEWAEFYDDLGDYFVAQTKISNVLAKLNKDKDTDFEEFKLRYDYYHRKIDKGYKKSFEEFKAEVFKQMKQVAQERNNEKGGTFIPPLRAHNPAVPANGNLPYGITWDELVKYHVGSAVMGYVNGVDQNGVFVTLARDFSGLIHWRNLMPEYEKHFSKNQPVRVRIDAAFESPKGKRIHLLLVP